MDRFQKILVYAPLHGTNDPALLRAANLAGRSGGIVEIVDVVEELPAYVRLVAPSSWDVAGLIAADRDKHLEKAAGWLRERGIEASTQVLRGKPEIAVTEHVLAGKHDLVLKTARGEASARRVWFGLVARRLLRICPCPVWIVQPDGPPRFERIVAAIDPDENDAEKTGLNRKIIDLASSLAEHESGELHIVHAWTAPGETLFRSRMPLDELADYVTDCKEAARRRVHGLLSHYDQTGERPHIHLLKGDPQDVIIDFVAQERADLVVMGTVCRGGIAGYLIGNTAEKVLRHIGSSVLAVKPDGFQSPVTLMSPAIAAHPQHV